MANEETPKIGASRKPDADDSRDLFERAVNLSRRRRETLKQLREAVAQGNKDQVFELAAEFRQLEEEIGDLDDEASEWLPTADNVNALPEPIRRYIHDIISCEPGYMVEENIILRQQVDGLTVMSMRLSGWRRRRPQSPRVREGSQC
jgi:hypothetical protein